jgi:hypothetical protein
LVVGEVDPHLGVDLGLGCGIRCGEEGLVAEDLPGAGACEVSGKDCDGTIADFIGPDGLAELVVSHDRVVTV